MVMVSSCLQLEDSNDDSLTSVLLKYVRNPSACPPLSAFLQQLKVPRSSPSADTSYGCVASSVLFSNSLSIFYPVQQVDMGGGEDGEWAADVVLDQLRGLRSPDDLIVLFLALLELVTERPESEEGEMSGFDPQSALGSYLHRCNIGFAELPFEVCLSTPLSIEDIDRSRLDKSHDY